MEINNLQNTSELQDGQQADGRYCRWFTPGATEVDLNNRLRLKSLLGFFQSRDIQPCLALP